MVAPHAVHAMAERLEAHLGDPATCSGPLSFGAILASDEAETFPEQACGELTSWGLNAFFVPRDDGGKLTSFEEALALLRVISRRDLTCAIALGQTYLGAVHVWIGGDPAQRRQVARCIADDAALAFALTERDHGSDVLAGEVRAQAVEGGYRLSGEKWLINNGTRARLLTVFARTAAAGPRGFSLFCLDVPSLAPSSYEHLAKIHTHGIRGADISGIRFHDAYVPAAARIGAAGIGLELALKGLMITRTMCAGFALGAADTALRLGLRFARSRILYGAPVFALADARRSLIEAFADLMAADALAVTASRALHVNPEEISVRSAIVKYLVPTLAEATVQAAGMVLGARNFVRGILPWAIFQKLARDVAVVGLFDGNTAVNLNAIVVQLPALLRARGPDADDARRLRLARLFDRQAELDPFDPSRLALASRGRDDVVDGLPLAASHVAARAVVATGDDVTTFGVAARIAGELVDARAALAQEVSAWRTQADRTSATAFESARRYCYLHAAAVLVHTLATASGGELGRAARPPTMVLALARLARRAGVAVGTLPENLIERAGDDLVQFEREQLLFSLFPFQIADAGSAANAAPQAVSS